MVLMNIHKSTVDEYARESIAFEWKQRSGARHLMTVHASAV